MKHLVLFLILPLSANTQQLDPIWKLKWGMTYETAVEHIKKTRNINPVSIKGDTSFRVAVEYRGQTFDGEKSLATVFYFIRNRFTRTEIYFVGESGNVSNVFSIFNSIKSKITAKYFESQYCEEAEGYIGSNKLNAIIQNKASFYCNWFFPKDDDSEKGGRLNLSITEQGAIVLIYDYSKAYSILNSDF